MGQLVQLNITLSKNTEVAASATVAFLSHRTDDSSGVRVFMGDGDHLLCDGSPARLPLEYAMKKKNIYRYRCKDYIHSRMLFETRE
ncbi:hypothetical protein EVAR_208_1 [Eumeta japonica]|uniref:Uncharacterized protein n=1 Tax=Eumeta variegata TaxID=151549 RepID=A0A4C1SA04_EUMVA|nr:hypothetical protein EVAR_208_1 [Eumeta japonica]